MSVLSELNWLAILAATIAGFVIGGLWYGPLFGNAWVAALGKKDCIPPFTLGNAQRFSCRNPISNTGKEIIRILAIDIIFCVVSLVPHMINRE